jgi:hypothetical protein
MWTRPMTNYKFGDVVLIRKLGALSDADRKAVEKVLRVILG